MNLDQLLNNGAALRYRPSFGFYAVLQGVTHPVREKDATAAIKASKVKPEGKNPFGVYFFSRA